MQSLIGHYQKKNCIIYNGRTIAYWEIEDDSKFSYRGSKMAHRLKKNENCKLTVTSNQCHSLSWRRQTRNATVLLIEHCKNVEKSQTHEPGFIEHVSDMFNNVWEMLQKQAIELCGYEIKWLHIVIAVLIMLIMMVIGYHVHCARRKMQNNKGVQVTPPMDNDVPPELNIV